MEACSLTMQKRRYLICIAKHQQQWTWKEHVQASPLRSCCTSLVGRRFLPTVLSEPKTCALVPDTMHEAFPSLNPHQAVLARRLLSRCVPIPG